MDYSKIKETLIEERTENRQKIKQNEENIVKLKELISSIDTSVIEELRKKNVFIDDFSDIDYEELKTNQSAQLQLIDRLTKNLERVNEYIQRYMNV